MKFPHTPYQVQLWKERPYSWSQHSCFLYNPAEWYDRYILGNATKGNAAMEFGKKFAASVEWGEAMAPVEILPEVEYKIQVPFDTFSLVGFIDSYLPHTALREYKTGKSPWTKAKVDKHDQITFYLLLLHLAHKVRPESVQCALQWIPTDVQPDYTFGFKLDAQGHAMIHTFPTKRTLTQVLKFANEIKATRAKMLEFIHNKELA